eukprot:gene3285-6504_t
MVEEEFRPIKEFPIYAISNFGNIANLRTGKIKKPHDNGRGYYDVLFYKNKIRHTFRVHRLVAEIFIDNVENKPEIDHIDGNKHNNKVDNLRWCTKTENTRNRKIRTDNKTGVKGVTYYQPSKKWMAKITIDGIQIYLGLFNSIEEAKYARQEKAKLEFGDFIHG